MGRSERKTINNNLRRKDKGITTEGMRRKGDPPRSERKWWKKDYSGWWTPSQEYFINLERMRENRRKQE